MHFLQIHNKKVFLKKKSVQYAAIITTITNTKNITMKKHVAAVMNIIMKKEHVAVIMNITTITIIMRMKYLQAGDRRPLINTQKRSWIFC